MEKSFILIKTETASETSEIERAHGKIEKIPEVVEASRTFGQFDIIAIVETESVDELTKRIDEIRRIDGVKETETYRTH